VLLAFLLVLLLPDARAGKLVLWIQAGNPIEKTQTVRIRSNLPPGVRTNDVINLDGLDLGYDVKKDIYYVYKELELGPKKTIEFKVEIDDIWVIPEGEMEGLWEKAAELVGKLTGSEHHEAAEGLAHEVRRNIDLIQEYQAKNAMGPGVKPVRHITAYEANLKMLSRVKRDIGRLENLVLVTGQDPGELIGEVRTVGKPTREIELSAEDYRTALIRITVRNTSPTEARKVDVRRDLPPEIRIYDVLDAGGLEVGKDSKSGACYVHAKNVEIGADQEVSFDVKIRDKWNVNVPRVQSLKSSAGDILARVRLKEKYESLERTLLDLIDEIGEMEKEKGPDTLSEEYVAFYRGQAGRLGVIEQKINRIESALRPVEKTTKLGFNVKPPSMRTTWMIIYIILGFLAVMSLLFFLRWFGRTKAERMPVPPQTTDNK